MMKQNENEMNFSVPLEIIKASEIEPKEVKWLWYPYIPFGKVTLLQGDPGDGKSKLMLSIAALLSKGEPLPFTETEENEPMTIIYQTTEDDADDTVVPRFNSAGGDGENLIFIKEDEKTLSFGDNRIREAIKKYNLRISFRALSSVRTAAMRCGRRVPTGGNAPTSSTAYNTPAIIMADMAMLCVPHTALKRGTYSMPSLPTSTALRIWRSMMKRRSEP